MTISRLACLAVVGGVLIGALAAQGPAGSEKKADKFWVYIGTYSGPKSKGIYRAELDLKDGKLSAARIAHEANNPSFLAIHPNRKFLYAVSEIGRRVSSRISSR